MAVSEGTRKRYRHLQEELAHHAQLYYGHDRAVIADSEYDRLYREAEQLERDHPELLSADSISQKVGVRPLRRFPTLAHLTPVLSLKNAFAAGQVRKFVHDLCVLLNKDGSDGNARAQADESSIELMTEPKLDGMSLSLIYRHGDLHTALTRGDGAVGEVVTANARAIKNIPQHIDKFARHERVEVRGEVIITRTDFAVVQAQLADSGKAVANARNFVAGSIRQLDSSVAAQRPLRFYGYRLLQNDLFSAGRQSEVIDLLHSCGFTTTAADNRLCRGAEAALAYYEEIRARHQEMIYEADGLVIKLNDLRAQDRVGVIEGQAPRWALAFKFPPESALTTLRAVALQVGRTGVLTPVAELEPVHIEGVTVTRASLHNFSRIRRKDIRVGDRVEIRRAGGVIPELVRVALEQSPATRQVVNLPTHCPECGSLLRVSPGKALLLYCPDQIHCPAQKINRLIHFCSREAMDITSMGTAFIETLVSGKFIASIADIYRLHLRREELCKLEGYGEQSIDNALMAIELSKTRPYHALISALGIPNLGKLGAQRLARAFPDIDLLSRAVVRAYGFFAPDGPAPAIVRRLPEVCRYLPDGYADKALADSVACLEAQSLDSANQLSKKAKNEIRRFVLALNRLKDYFTSLNNVVDALPDYQKFRDLDISQVRMADLYAYFSDQSQIAIIESLKQAGVRTGAGTDVAPEQTGGSLSGKTVLVTGKFDDFTRRDIEKACANQGATVVKSFSRQQPVTLLMCGDKPGPNKIARAQKDGVEIWDKAGFFERVPVTGTGGD